MNTKRLFLNMLIGFLCLLLFSAQLQLTAHAVWPFDLLASKTEEDFKPPAADEMELKCDPIRQKIVKLNQKNKVIHPFYRPRIGLLKNKYNRCTQKFRDQEYKYLKHVQVTPASEKKIETSDDKPAASPDLAPLGDPRLKKNAEHGLDASLFGTGGTGATDASK